MNASELASKMLEWEQKRIELDELENEIINEVLAIGSTQKVGNVSANYRNPSKSYDYQGAVENSGYEYDLNGYVKTDYDWRRLAKDLGLEDIPYTVKGEPSVTLKLK